MARTNDLLSRRSFVQIGAAGLATLPFFACSTDSDHCQRSARDLPAALSAGQTALDLFPLGVQAGAITGESALIWGFTQASTAARLRVFKAGTKAEDAEAIYDEQVSAQQGYLRVRLENLQPGAHYYYAFFADDERRSAIGRFVSGVAEDCRRPLILAATSCTKFDYAPFRSLVRAAERELDLFIHLGDMSYNDGAQTADEYRALWHKTLADPGYQAILSRTGICATLDDHEIVDNSKLYPVDPALIATALDAYAENVAIQLGPARKIWRSYRWGKTAEFFVLDCRTERKPASRETAQAEYISEAQLSWLTSALSASPCHFKVMLNSVPITRFPDFWPEQDDRWQGYAAQRQRLLDHIADNQIRNVWWLSGDFHIGVVARVEPEPGHRLHGMWEILAGPGGNAAEFWKVVDATPHLKRIGVPQEQIIHFSSRIATTIVTLDPVTDTVNVEFIDAETGEMMFNRALVFGG
ncbi:MAG: alkaline phosphatase D family protein [Deltaproteobacteria bacterium]|nr:alkaline phosphatase D family protein [Deltaproteobacteria bacterium]